MKQTNTSLIVLFFALLLSSQTLFGEGVVISNKSTGIDSISAAEVKSLFLKKKDTFANGAHVVVADQSDDSANRKEFTKKVIGKKSKKLKVYWSKRVFAGKGTPPKVIGDNKAMLEWVAKTPNSLGYVSADAVNDSVKVLLKY